MCVRMLGLSVCKCMCVVSNIECCKSKEAKGKMANWEAVVHKASYKWK